MNFTSKAEEKYYYEHQASEKAFLAWYLQQDRPKYETPSVTTDNVLFCYNRAEDSVKLLLIKRKAHPFQYSWALPGGFVNRNESTEACCLRETEEETGVQVAANSIQQLHTFSNPNRDPRGWVITVSYIAFIGEEPLTAGDDAKEAVWFTLTREDNLLHLSHKPDTKITINLTSGQTTGSERLAFDHSFIIQKAFQMVLNDMYHQPNVLRVLGSRFTITEARKVFARFLGVGYRSLDHSNFKKQLQPYIKEVGQLAAGIGRPSKLYELKKQV